MENCTIGEKVYLDLFGGFLKGIVMDINPYKLLSNPIPYMDLTVKITSKNNPCYKFGEIITVNSLHIIPRRFFHRTGIFRYVVYPDYIWSKGDN